MQEQNIQKQLDKIWNGWKVYELLGEGSFGQVYGIKREEFGHVYEAALKVITVPQTQSEIKSVMNEGLDENSVTSYFYSIVEDIVEEFALMARLKGNTNIVSYEDHAVIPLEGKIGWNIFIRMELLTPLLDYLKDHKLSIRDVINLGIDMCQAMEICQKYNIIHRDIKPENIFVSDIGKYKLGDFGIARKLEKTSGNLSKKGTLNYMAPEIYKGEEYNSTVDIYSLGIVLYRFLNNNRIPFLPSFPIPLKYSDKETANVKRMSGAKMPYPCNAEGRLAEIVLKACSYNPKERYDSAIDMKKALQAVLYEESERDIIYPEGDELKNDKSIYDISGPIETEEEKKELTVSEEDKEDNSTRYLFDTDEVRQKIMEKVEEKQRIENSFVKEEKKEESCANDRFVKRSNSGKKGKVIVALIGLLVAGGVGVKYYTKSQQQEAPNLVDLTLEEAVKLAKQEGKNIVIKKGGEDYSDTVKEGEIISQNVKPGTIIENGEEIQVIISLGEQLKVPGLIGISKKEAKKLAEEAKLEFSVEKEVYSDKVKAGVVISQSIQEGSNINGEERITVVISKGKEYIEVPDIEGLKLEKAKKILKNAGLAWKITKEYSNKVEKDKIISQGTKSGSKVDKNTQIQLIVSRGKKKEVVVKEETTQASVQVVTPVQTPPSTSVQTEPAENNNNASDEEWIEFDNDADVEWEWVE